MSCRPMVRTSSTVRSPMISRMTLSERSRNVFSGSRAPNKYIFGSVMRYCTTQGTSAVLRSPVIIVSVSAACASPWYALVAFSLDESELQFEQPLRRNHDDFIDVGNGVAETGVFGFEIGAETNLHPDRIGRNRDEAEQQGEENHDHAEDGDHPEDQANGLDLKRGPGIGRAWDDFHESGVNRAVYHTLQAARHPERSGAESRDPVMEALG